MNTQVKFWIFALGELKNAGLGNSLIDAIIFMLKGFVPYVLTTREDGAQIAMWLVAIKITHLFRRKRVAVANNYINARSLESLRQVQKIQIERLRQSLRIEWIQIESYALNRLTPAEAIEISNSYSTKTSIFKSYINLLEKDKIVDNLPAERRRGYRKGFEENLMCGTVLPFTMIKMATSTYTRRGDSLPLGSKFRLLVLWMLSKFTNQVRIYGVIFENRPQNFAIIRVSENSSVYLYGGSSPEPHRFAGVFLQVEIMKFLAEDGIKYYDFGGANSDDAKSHEISKFKKLFGGEEKFFANINIAL